jgi:predicted AAA+ superfamily ATPase
MLEESIRKWNPWWVESESIKRLTGVKRYIITDIKKTLKLKQIKDIIGIRRSGKTTILYQIIKFLEENGEKSKNIVFLNFDDTEINSASFDEIIKAIEKINPETRYLFLDEIQQKNGWERWIRTLYDTDKYAQIFISGSSASLLTKDVARVLTGRHITFTIFPFSFVEYLVFIGWKDFSEDYLEYNKNKILHYLLTYIKGGGFPEVIGKNEFERKIILTNIYNDILARDISARHNVSYDISRKISYHLLSNNSKEFSFRSIANAIDASVETVETHLEYLKESYILLTLNVFSYKTKIQFKQNKKSYCIDTGLKNAVSFKFSEDIGRLVENMVFLEILRRGKEVFFWKNKNQQEVDFIIKDGLKPIQLIQVCWDIKNEKTKKREIEGLLSAMEEFKLKKGLILTEDYEEIEKYNQKEIRYKPLWKWLILK